MMKKKLLKSGYAMNPLWTMSAIICLSLARPEASFDKVQCKICGGACCKNSGCYFSPKDFKKAYLWKKMRSIISKGYISLVFVPKMQTGLEQDVIIVKSQK